MDRQEAKEILNGLKLNELKEILIDLDIQYRNNNKRKIVNRLLKEDLQKLKKVLKRRKIINENNLTRFFDSVKKFTNRFNRNDVKRIAIYLSLLLFGLFFYQQLGKVSSDDISTNLIIDGDCELRLFDDKSLNLRSPICGCFTKAETQKGIIFLSKNLKIKNQSKEDTFEIKSSFSITAPKIGSLNNTGGYTISAEYFLLKRKDIFAEFDVQKFVNQGKVSDIQFEVINKKQLPQSNFYSIISKSNELEITPLTDNPVFNIMPEGHSTVRINKSFDDIKKYDGKLEIEEKYSEDFDYETHNNLSPFVEVSAQYTAFTISSLDEIINDDAVYLSNRFVVDSLINVEKDSLIKLLIVRVPHTLRVANSNWNESMHKKWRKQKLSQEVARRYELTEVDSITYFFDAPFVFRLYGDPRMYIVEYDSLSILEPPNIIGHSLIKTQYFSDKLFDDENYNRTRNYLISNHEQWVAYEKAQKEINLDLTRIKDKQKNIEIGKYLEDEYPKLTYEKHQNLVKYYRSLPESEVEDYWEKENDISGKSAAFYNIKLPEDNGITVYLDYDYLASSEPKGSVRIGNETLEYDSPSNLEISFSEKPTKNKRFFTVPITNVKDTKNSSLVLSGKGSVYSNGEQQGSIVFSQYLIQFIGLFLTCIGGIAVLVQIYFAYKRDNAKTT